MCHTDILVCIGEVRQRRFNLAHYRCLLIIFGNETVVVPVTLVEIIISCLTYAACEYALARKSQTGELCGVYPVHIHIAGIYVKALSCIAYCVTVRQVVAGYIERLLRHLYRSFLDL